MIKAVIKRDEEGNIKEFEIDGHAGYASHGEDVVCAAVSALAQTALLGLHHHGNIICTFKIDKGYLYCKVPSEMNEEKRIVANAILETLLLGLKNIKEGYSSYIKLKEEEV